MEKECEISARSFTISAQDREFYERHNLPLPRLSPVERLRRRMTRRNFSSLYLRQCDMSGERTLSRYPAASRWPVYSPSSWWSDRWNALTFGREFDFSRPFFGQFQELCNKVPQPAVQGVQVENCDYSNHAFHSKDCYMIFGCVRNEHCLYGHIVWNCEHCVDSLYLFECQWCSHSIDCLGCYDVHYSTESVNCSESYFLHDCRNCSNCFGCTNLRNKSYCLFNKQYSKEEYSAQLAKVMPEKWEDVCRLDRWLEETKHKKALFPPSFSSNAEDSTGNHLYYSSGLSHCFDVKNGEKCKYCFTNFDILESYDVCFGGGRFSYECMALVDSERVQFSNVVVNSSDVLYSEHCYSSQNLFGCSGLRNAQYCILNKQYSKKEYFELKAKLIQHMQRTKEWGEFFPSVISPFAYNESCAQEYLPLSKTEVLKRNLRWDDELGDILDKAPADAALSFAKISEIGDDILKQKFLCSRTSKEFKITRAELDYYRRMQLPLPTVCPKLRSALRMRRRSKRELYRRKCVKCSSEVVTAISAEEAVNLCCENCYLKGIA